MSSALLVVSLMVRAASPPVDTDSVVEDILNLKATQTQGAERQHAVFVRYVTGELSSRVGAGVRLRGRV